MAVTPLPLPANQPADRFYAGGGRIAEFRRQVWDGSRVPEDWVGSTTTLFGEGALGLTVLDDGRTLRDAVGADPRAWLGEAHVARFGADTRLLTKLLDAGQRLPVHLHPDGAFAAEHLGCAHGKTEAWVFLRGGEVHLGWRAELSADRLRRLVDDQDVDGLLAAMHRVEVAPGDAVFVPAGMPHAIGAGTFLVEVQEPEDLSILLEWRDFALDGPRDGHLGLGFDRALQATDLAPRTADQVEALVVRAGATGPVLPAAADSFFRVDRVAGRTELAAGFAVVVVTDGAGVLSSGAGSLQVEVGDTVLVPAAAGATVLDSGLTALVCRPPAP
ncbi:class I mannose-6-phosphate isomerase [Modestobacter sp. VKM Ac-2986]|uniref:class I mannose-6-phosphate isomerase n=1 Tax=Modestobacter sp. VKM Ac-2986 TaxID=3004140 RepID=UPI0022AB1A53|nr:class I mannose-6-phosphate isomerase [Modestobacter sp. VKM Ac-2986]MCZ2828627.1 class I mannose-6-phosphate isomerase [Modestobacter sp. VKM Ac-2986]